GHWRGDDRARQIGLRLLERRARLRQLAKGEIALGLQNAKLLVGRRCIGLRSRQGGFAFLKVRHVLWGLLDRSASLACQLLIAVCLLARESQRRLRLRYLLVGLVYLCLLRCDLSSQIVDARLPLVDLLLRLIALGYIIAVVKTNQFSPGIDELIVGDR